MKLSFTVLAPLAVLLQTCSANFDVYQTKWYEVTGAEGDGWQIFQNDPSCGDVGRARSYGDYGDVSRTEGVRCAGDCNRDPTSIDVLEMHFNSSPLFAWTIYKDRGHPYKMYGRDGRVYGECIIFPGVSYSCPGGRTTTGRRQLRCLTQYNAQEVQFA